MVAGSVANEVIASFPGLEGPIRTLITILQILGGLIGVYVIFWVINSFINARRIKILQKILANLEEINQKIGKSKIIKRKRDNSLSN